MSKWIQFIALALLAGCSTSPRREKESLPPDWQSETFTNRPAPVHTNAAPKPLVQTNHISEPWVSLAHWSKFYSLPLFRQISGPPTRGYALTVPEGVLLVHVNSRSAFWNGVEFQLGSAPRLIDGQPFINTIDGEKNLLPLLRPLAQEPKPNRILVIDPGHGGADVGAKNIFNSRYEKEFTLDCARRLQSLLSTNGWKIFLTRSNDTDISLTERVAFADRVRADIFISLHFNAGGPASYGGLETYCLTPQGLPSNLTREFADDPAAHFPNNDFDAQNFQFAEKIHRALLRLDGKIDRGVRRARFMTVLRWQRRPAVLIEGGYLSSRDEAKLIADADYRQKFAEAIAKVFVVKPETPAPDDNDR